MKNRYNSKQKNSIKGSGFRTFLLVDIVCIVILIGLFSLSMFGNHSPEANAGSSGIIGNVQEGITDIVNKSGLSDILPSDTKKDTPVPKDTPESFSLTMLDVGQGLSVLIESDGEYMVYDGGGKERSSYVVSYCLKHKADHLKYLVASHYDEDHIAGLVGLLNTTTVDEVICGDYETDTKIYKSFINKVEEKGFPVVHPSVGDKFTLGRATITVLSPKDYFYSEDNNNSIVLRIEKGDFSALLMGDAEIDAEADMLAKGLVSNADLLVVGHHGSSDSSSLDFLNKVSPKYAFIGVGADNQYGHPTDQTLNNLKSCGAEIYRTDENGEIVLTIEDGNIVIK